MRTVALEKARKERRLYIQKSNRCCGDILIKKRVYEDVQKIRIYSKTSELEAS